MSVSQAHLASDLNMSPPEKEKGTLTKGQASWFSVFVSRQASLLHKEMQSCIFLLCKQPSMSVSKLYNIGPENIAKKYFSNDT